ncbi:MAG: cytidylate kinase-like family protein [Desulfobacteraceae bacterium]|nr:cytidylate kinase-like family protein [Desulfobacteraceae bacterium]
MSIVTVARGSYSHGQEIAEKVAQKLGYNCISREVILEASKEFNIPEIKLMQAFEDSPSIVDRFIHGKRRYIAYTRAVLLDHLTKGNVVYHGFAGHFFVEGISHVLKILITAKVEDRISLVMERDKISRKEAILFIKKIDDQRRKWGQMLYGIEPWDPCLYDLTFHIDRITVEDAVDTICQVSRLEQFQTNPESEKAFDDLVLTVKVANFLIDVRPRVDVYIDNKFVYLKPPGPLSQDSEVVSKMGEIMKTIPGIRGIKVAI